MKRSNGHGVRRLPLGLALAAAALSALLYAPAGVASSIVLLKDGNVWLAKPDGSGLHQVTLDGSPGSPYRSPTQADDGTIVAQRGTQGDARLHRMKQNGALLNAPIGTAAPGTGPLDPTVSPDGTKVTFWFITVVTPCWWCYGLRYAQLYTYSDRFTDPSVFGRQDSRRQPSWMGNGKTLGFYGVKASYQDVGAGQNSYTDWFSEADYVDDPAQWLNLYQGEVSRDGQKLAVARRNDDNGGTILLYRTNGGPPAKPTPLCELSGPVGTFSHPTWSPDGTKLAWAEGNGIWSATVPPLLDETACAGISPNLLIPGGSAPDWGPAEVAPPRQPQPQPQPQPLPVPQPGPGPGPQPQPKPKPKPKLQPAQRLCVVPKVVGLRLAVARTKIRKANCSVGRTRRAKSNRIGRVIVQSPRPGARRPRGAGVKLVVGRR
jgi:hypothetical protein